MVLIEWIDQLHSSPSVNVIRYMEQLLHKFLSVIGAQEDKFLQVTTAGNQEAEQSALGKKALEQLRYFLEDLKDASYRTLVLDSEVIPILTDFLLSCDESKQVAILCSLDWLNHFIDFFREDFLATVDRARSNYLANNPGRPIGSGTTQTTSGVAGIEEESKEPAIAEETKSSIGAGNLLQIDTTGGGANNTT